MSNIIELSGGREFNPRREQRDFIIHSAILPERSKGDDLRSSGQLTAWVRIPQMAITFFKYLNGNGVVVTLFASNE